MSVELMNVSRINENSLNFVQQYNEANTTKKIKDLETEINHLRNELNDLNGMVFELTQNKENSELTQNKENKKLRQNKESTTNDMKTNSFHNNKSKLNKNLYNILFSIIHFVIFFLAYRGTSAGRSRGNYKRYNPYRFNDQSAKKQIYFNL